MVFSKWYVVFFPSFWLNFFYGYSGIKRIEKRLRKSVQKKKWLVFNALACQLSKRGGSLVILAKTYGGENIFMDVGAKNYSWYNNGPEDRAINGSDINFETITISDAGA